MEAAIYNLADMRSQRHSAMPTAANLCLRMMADGLAATLSAQSFFVQYVAAMGRFHASLLNAGSSSPLSPTKSEERPIRW